MRLINDTHRKFREALEELFYRLVWVVVDVVVVVVVPEKVTVGKYGLNSPLEIQTFTLLCSFMHCLCNSCIGTIVSIVRCVENLLLT